MAGISAPPDVLILEALVTLSGKSLQSLRHHISMFCRNRKLMTSLLRGDVTIFWLIRIETLTFTWGHWGNSLNMHALLFRNKCLITAEYLQILLRAISGFDAYEMPCYKRNQRSMRLIRVAILTSISVRTNQQQCSRATWSSGNAFSWNEKCCHTNRARFPLLQEA